MSIKVFERLMKMLVETTHEERVEIDKEIEKKTKKYCDEGVNELSDTEFIEIVNKVKKKRKKKRAEQKEDEQSKEEQEEDGQVKYERDKQEAREKIEVAA